MTFTKIFIPWYCVRTCKVLKNIHIVLSFLTVHLIDSRHKTSGGYYTKLVDWAEHDYRYLST